MSRVGFLIRIFLITLGFKGFSLALSGEQTHKHAADKTAAGAVAGSNPPVNSAAPGLVSDLRWCSSGYLDERMKTP